MLRIRHSRTRLWGIAVLSAMGVAFLLGLFLYPDERLPGLLGLLVNGDFGHWITLPILVPGLAVTGFRAAWLGAEATDAIVADGQGITVTSMWKSRHADWSEVMQVRVVERTYRRHRYWYLMIDRRDGGSIQLLLSSTELSPFSYYQLREELEQMHLHGIRSPLVTRAQDIPAPVAPSLPATPPRPSFGRKTG
jgi:hypothetical protein